MRNYPGLNGLSGAFSGSRSNRLEALQSFGSDPGALLAYTYVPADLQPKSPLVVVLHGCTQTAEAYDRGSGWSLLAERCGFAVLFPEQTRTNNANTCFNWFLPDDVRRGGGEALSIREMVEAVAVRRGIDRSRIFVTGLSAGGAMAAAMLASYPEVFSGGGIIAGLPYGVAGSVGEAFARMQGQGLPPPAQLAAKVRDASDHKGPWPTISIWQGSADHTVAPSNAEALVAQWRGVHALPPAGAARLEAPGRHARKVWSDARGRDVIECVTISGMGHGAPVDARSGYGEAGPYMLDVGISSTLEIARFWGIAGRDVPQSILAPDRQLDVARAERASAPNPEAVRREPAGNAGGKLERVIQDALRKAGLMR